MCFQWQGRCMNCEAGNWSYWTELNFWAIMIWGCRQSEQMEIKVARTGGNVNILQGQGGLMLETMAAILFFFLFSLYGLSYFIFKKISFDINLMTHILVQNGVVHRDLKLENILLDDAGNAKVLQLHCYCIYFFSCVTVFWRLNQVSAELNILSSCCCKQINRLHPTISSMAYKALV